MKLDRRAIKLRAMEYGVVKYGYEADDRFEMVVDCVVEALCDAIDPSTPTVCPRQHLGQAAEQRAREEQGPCMCASCVACRARPMVPNVVATTHPLDQRKEACPGCGHRSRITTAGCDRCDREDK